MNAEGAGRHSAARSGQEFEPSAQRYRRLIEAVTDYIFTVRVENGRPIETIHGSNCLAVTGYTPEEFAANPMLWIAMVPEEDRAAVEQQAACILSGQKVPPVEHRICRKDGVVLWVLNTSVAHYDDQGKLVAYDGLLRDVTDRKEAETARRRLNETLEQRVADRTAELEAANRILRQTQFTIDHSQDAVFWIRPDGRLFFVNDMACEMSGYPRHELLGLAVTDLDLDLSPAEWSQLWQRARSRRSLLMQRRCRTKSGDCILVEVFGGYFEFAGDEFMCAFVRDVSEWKQIEQRLRAILDTAADAIITIDTQGIIQAVNPATAQMFGYEQGDLIGQNVRILMPSPYREEHDGYIARYVATGEARIICIGREVVGRRKDGSPFPVDLAVSEIKDLGLFTGIIRDLTDRKRLQKQVLDIAVREQTRIGQDLHDGVGQELTALNYMTQSLLASLADKSQPTAQLAQKITDGIKNTQQLLRKIIEGFMPVNVDPEGLRAALEDLVTRLNGTHSVATSLTCRGDTRLKDNATATSLFRIAQEAVNNALKHSQGDQIEISLSATPDSVTLEIRDNGVGFDTTPREAQGMGLGIMQYRASVIGATLGVASRPEGGTIVRCEFCTASG